MAKSNIRLLTKDERAFFNDNYVITLKDDMILVKCKSYGRLVAHPVDCDFSISAKVRKISISKEAIQLWKDKFIGTASLFDVQNAMNALTIAYQATDYEDVKEQLTLINDKERRAF